MRTLTIAGRELRTLFYSPVAWIILGITQALLAYVFLIQIDQFVEVQPRLAARPGAPGLTQIVVAPLFRWAGTVLMLTVPFITMRVVSEERRTGTLVLLLSAPVSMTEIVVGKYLGVIAFLALTVALVALMPLTLLAGGTLDLGLLGSGLLGLALLVCGSAAAGIYMSTLTSQPTIAAISTFGLLLLLWLLGESGAAGADAPGSLLTYVALSGHYENLLRGIFDSGDVIYFLLLTAVFLVLAIRRLDRGRVSR